MSARARARPSLSARLLRHVMLPLALTWALGSAIAVLVGDEFTQQAFDSALLDDAFALSANVRQTAEELNLRLDDQALDAVLFDQSETMYYAVLADDGSLIAGQAGLDVARRPPGKSGHAFSNIVYDGLALRAVRLRHAEAPAFTVVIAQTTANRSQLVHRLLFYATAPQLLLLALVAWGLRGTIRRDIAPLVALQRALDQRDVGDLSPVPPALIHDANSREVERLGVAIDGLLIRIGDGVRAQREFAGNVAHELRTPLAGIRALAEYGLAQNDPAVQRAQLRAIAVSETRASHLIDQLLALALADESRSSMQLEPVALGQIAREVVLQRLPRADAVGIDLGAQGLDQSVTVLANPALVEGVLFNLIDNAMRHGRPGTDEVAVLTVELVQAGDEARLSVIDNGPGLTADERQGLLQRWAQGAKRQRIGEGAGLGLAIVARYADLMQARFELETPPGGNGLRASIVFKVALD